MLLRDGRTLIGYLRSIDQFGITHSITFHLFLLVYGVRRARAFSANYIKAHMFARRLVFHLFYSRDVILHCNSALHASDLVFSSPPANLVFHQTVERIHVGKKFGDIPRGIFIVRGENVVLLGEIVSGKALALFDCLVEAYKYLK